MTITIPTVRPGDLITASWMNNLITQLQALETRLAALEGVVPGAGDQVVVSQLLPSNSVRVQDTLYIVGAGFGVPQDNVVTFDGASPVRSFLAGSRDTTLIIQVPVIPIGGDSQVFQLVVSNARGSSPPVPIVLAPGAPAFVDGKVIVTLPQLPNPVSGNAVFGFNLASTLNMDETFTLASTAPAGWNAQLFADAAGTQPLPSPLSIAKQPSDQVARNTAVFLRAAIPTGDNGQVRTVGLVVTSVHNPGKITDGFSQSLTVGGAPPPPQNVGFQLGLVFGGSKVGDAVVFTVPPPAPQKNRLIMTLSQLTANTVYDIDVDFASHDANNHGWAMTIGTDINVITHHTTITMVGGGNADLTLSFGATPPLSENTLVVTVRSQAHPTTDFGIRNQVIRSA